MEARDHATTSTGPDARRGVVLSVIGNLGAPAAAFISAPLLARALGVDGRGVVAAATAPLQLAAALMTLGLPDAVTYFASRGRSEGRSAFWRAVVLTLTVGAVATAVVVLAAPTLSGGNSQLGHLIQLAAYAILPTMLLALVRAYATGLQRWALVALDGTLSPFVRLGALVLLVAIDQLGLTTGTIVMASTGFISVFLYLGLIRRERDSRESDQRANPIAYRTIVGFGAGAWAGSVSGVLLSYLDQVLMTPLSATTQLGLYSVAVSVSQIVLVVNNAIRNVAFAVEARSPDMERLARLSRISTIVTFVVCAGVAALAPLFVPLLFGTAFSSAVGLVQILLLSTVLGNAGSIAGIGLMARGRPILRSWSLAAAALVNATLILVLVPRFGAYGAAWATAIGGLIAGNLNIVFLRAFFGVPMLQFYRLRAVDVAALFAYVRFELGHANALLKRTRPESHVTEEDD